jgi:drug/metabolite transporter (DMT)-like permease
MLWGGGAILLSAIMYAAGSVLSRSLLRAYPAIYVSGITLFCGGVVVTIASILFEAGVSWLFLVFGGSIAAYTIYLKLVRDWGPSRAGAYCFVSPAIAVAFGAALLGERLGVNELVGTVVMVTAAWLAVGSAEAGDAVIRAADRGSSAAEGSGRGTAVSPS